MKFSFKPLMLGAFVLAVGGVAVAGEPDAAKLEQGQTLFKADAVPACSVCHTLQKAGATGAIGPDLDAMKPSYEQVRAALRDGVGVMPSYEETLDEAALDAVATFVAHATRQ